MTFPGPNLKRFKHAFFKNNQTISFEIYSQENWSFDNVREIKMKKWGTRTIFVYMKIHVLLFAFMKVERG